MKRALIYFTLGLGVAYFLFAGGIRTKVQLTDQAQQNITVLASAAMRVTDHVKSWLSDYAEDTQPVMSTLEPLSQKESLIDYDAALKIVYEIIEDLEDIPCKNRGTSCPDQLAKALKIYKKYVLNK